MADTAKRTKPGESAVRSVTIVTPAKTLVSDSSKLISTVPSLAPAVSIRLAPAIPSTSTTNSTPLRVVPSPRVQSVSRSPAVISSSSSSSSTTTTTSATSTTSTSSSSATTRSPVAVSAQSSATSVIGASENKQTLAGKWALVAGAGKGIGTAIAVALAQEGAGVALCAKTQTELEVTAAACRAVGCENVEMYAYDLSQGKEVDALAEQMIQKHGGCEVLVNNSGGFSPGNPLEGDPDAWVHMFSLNVHAGMRLTRRLAPRMAERQSGAIFDIGSVAALESMSGEYAAYAASKWAMRGWGASSYLTLRHKNVKCCRINPAYVNTGFAVEGQTELIPERMIQTTDIANYIRFVLHTSAGCVPEEITLRLAMSAFK